VRVARYEVSGRTGKKWSRPAREVAMVEAQYEVAGRTIKRGGRPARDVAIVARYEVPGDQEKRGRPARDDRRCS
jgi:hypothetical protein